MTKKLNAEGSMIRSYTAGELPAGSYRMFVKGDFNGINSSASDGFTTLPAVYQIGSTDTKKEIKKEQLSTALDGWNYAVDEDRKFWKDDFSSNTLVNYYGAGTNGAITGWTWENGAVKFTTSIISEIINNQFTLGSGIYKGVFRLSKLPTATATKSIVYGISFAGNNVQLNNYNVRIFYNGTTDTYNIALTKARSSQFMTSASAIALTNFNPCIPHEIAVEYDAVTRLCIMYLDGVEKGRATETVLLLGEGFFGVMGTVNITDSPNIICEELTFIPKTAYSDGMSIDTTARYQAISGTNAFNTDKIVMTATPAAWNKTRLKSYKFESGRFRQKLTLPATGTANDIVAHFFNSAADGLTNYGVGVKRLSTNLWLPVEIKDNVVVTTGISPIAPIQDGNTIILEVEVDTVKGISWLSVWKDGTSNVMVFDGVNDKVVLSNTNLTNFTAKSVFIWCKIPAFVEGSSRVLYDAGYWTSTFGEVFQFSSVSNSLTVYLKNSLGVSIVKSIPYIPDTWCCIGYTWDGTTANFYYNSGQVNTGLFSGTLACSSYAVSVGSNMTGSERFNGTVSGLRIYNRGLSASEVTDLYKGISVSSGFVGQFVNTGNTDADWINRIDSTTSTVNGTPATVAVTGTKVQGTTLKQFAPYQIAHTAVGYYNAGAGDNTVALKLLECRARSLIGYTNVPATEEVVFNNDFVVDSRNAYINPTAWNYDAGLVNVVGNTMYTKNIYGKQTTEFYFTLNANDGIPICRAMITFCSQDTLTGIPYNFGNKYMLYFRGEVNTVRLLKITDGTISDIGTQVAFTYTYGTQYKAKVVFDPSLSTDKIKCYIATAAGTYPSTPNIVSNDTSFTKGYSGIGHHCSYSTGGRVIINKFNLSGTRITTKPMLRGAGLGSYYDGTNEVQTARFTDDFEYGSTDSAVTYDSNYWEIVDNRIHKKVNTNYSFLSINACKFGNGYYEFKWNPISNITTLGYSSLWFVFCCENTVLNYRVDISTLTTKLYYIKFRTGSTSIIVYKRDGTTNNIALGTITSPINFANGDIYNIKISVINGVITLFVNGISAGSLTDSTPLQAGYIGFVNIWDGDSTGHEYYIKNISVNGVYDSNTKLLGGSQYGGFFLGDGNPVNGGNFAGLKFTNHDRDTVYTNTINVGTSPVTDAGGVNYEIIRKNITDNTRISPTKEMVTALPIGAAATVTTADITLNADHANDSIGLYIQTKLDTAPVLQITSQTLARNTLVDTTANNYYYVDFDVGTGAIDVGVWETTDAGTVVDDCSTTTGWTKAYTNDGTITSDGSSITFTETADAGNRVGIQKNFNLSVGSNQFIYLKITSSVSCRLQFLVYGTTGSAGWYGDARFPLVAGVEQTFVLPLYAPTGTTGKNPTDSNITGTTITKIIVGCGWLSAGMKTVTIKPIYLVLSDTITNYLKMDYMEVVPKGLIEREVNRSLVTLNESKSYVTE